ncbi:MAG: hypothetical protein J6Z22_07820 [Lachnospiraceae bacterium]|nr:hypothetical protein [Bacillota bacterium]MBP5282395.1 hypothetical protein [Lachnospiraceae bacterium]
MNQAEINTKSIQSFATAALICGLLSVFTFWTAFLPLVFGGMGIVFAVLSRREDRPFPSASWWGVVASLIGIFMGIVILYYVMTNMVIPMMTDPAFYQEMKIYYQNNFGINLDDMMGVK